MHVIRARNAHQALPEALYQIKTHGVKRESRNGPVLKFPEPVTIVYEKPRERVVFWPERDANPTFHLMESLWMLAGRNDVEFPASLVARMASFSDDGETFNGAYGFRWRNHFRGLTDKPGAHCVIDQILTIGYALKENPNCRRQVLAMWDPAYDLGMDSKDLPCNTHAYFSLNDSGNLDMMVCNRSNDLVWGALGANVVHFSVLQEFLAAFIGCEVGLYWQTSNNMHLYLDTHAELMEQLASKAFPSTQAKVTCPYEQEQVVPYELIGPVGPGAQQFLNEVSMYLENGPALGMKSQFLRKVAEPLYSAYRHYKASEGGSRAQVAIDSIRTCKAADWSLAAFEWYSRRM